MNVRTLLRVLLPLALVGGLLAVALARIPYVSTLAKLFLASVLLLFFFVFLWRFFQKVLWTVGRRLAFSYFLIGGLPIPMVLLLLLVAAYIVAGFFMGHLFRDAARSLQGEVQALAESRLREYVHHGGAADPGDAQDVVFGYYRRGRRVAGDPRTPAAWPGYLQASPQNGSERRESVAPYFGLPDGTPTLAALAGGGDPASGTGVMALYVGQLEATLSARSNVWTEIMTPEEALNGDATVRRIQFGNHTIPLTRFHRERAKGDAQRFFNRRSEGARLWDSPILWWGEVAGEERRLEGGQVVRLSLDVALRSTPRLLLRHLFSSSAEVDTAAWGALFALAFLLFDVYVVATLLAVFMIFGLSRAVNRMSRATAALQQGDFTVRIPVRRKDQVGELQRSFNEMAGNLQTLVATAAQKEALEKELQIARELQKSLLPGTLPTGGAVELASLFEPSAAIGGDYFDILRLSADQMAVIIADVSGHGLSTGLRMAMIKAALQILVQQQGDPAEILAGLDSVVRADPESRFFVTATLAILDFRAGTMSITNAGHPPTYLLRGGTVEEIVLPGSPLGGMGKQYGRRELSLERGDILVWLSDGLIEATNAAGDPFGYDAVVAALAGPAASPTEIRDRLLTAVAAHTAGEPQQDDRTLLVMRYLGE